MQSTVIQKSRFLIVDDEPQNVNLLEQMLRQWDATNIVSTTDSCETVSLFHAFQPDIILLDLMMPRMDGYEVLETIQGLLPPEEFLPILVLTADNTDAAKRRALGLGAADFLTKPFDATELFLRIQNLLSRRSLQRSILTQNEILDQQVRERTSQLERAEIEAAECLAIAGEYRDDETGDHTRRVGNLSARLARQMGLDDAAVALIGRAAPLHDVGKIGIPDGILLKPEKLTAEEFAVMETHTSIGGAILGRHHTPLLQLAATIARTHHERWNGWGYPDGLSGDEIPLPGRIVAVADVFDALTHDRPYKKAWPIDDAVTEIVRQSGSQFDPSVVAAFVACMTEKF